MISCLYLPVCCCVHRRRLLPIIVAPNTQKGWKPWTPQIQRSGPLNRSPRKPHCKSSHHPAHSPQALTQHQEVCVSAGTHSPVCMCVLCVCVCMCVQTSNVWQRYMHLRLKPSFPSHDFNSLKWWTSCCFGFHSEEIKVWALSSFFMSTFTDLRSWDQKHIENALNMIHEWLCSVCVCACVHGICQHKCGCVLKHWLLSQHDDVLLLNVRGR